MKDYYTNIKEDIGIEKEYKTWIEQLLYRGGRGSAGRGSRPQRSERGLSARYWAGILL